VTPLQRMLAEMETQSGDAVHAVLGPERRMSDYTAFECTEALDLALALADEALERGRLAFFEVVELPADHTWLEFFCDGERHAIVLDRTEDGQGAAWTHLQTWGAPSATALLSRHPMALRFARP
jgi:hypothetical protein